ncbi:hypothetical protein PQR01_00200 [Paraburkholderia rhynchosiae]|uniref:Uncharacterized protein n=1 Tax=Paraburkholderia rhynchosiae TaxID=487049 RepID=A0ACC7N3I1_9BURK
MNTTTNTGAASLSDEQWYDLAQRHANADWNSNGYLDAIKAVCTDYAALTTPQADAAPILSGHAINEMFLKWSEWTTELGEAISSKNIEGFVSDVRAAIAAGGAQEPDELRAIHDLLHTQDNRITAAPMFAVQQRKRVYGIDTDYEPKIVWTNEEGSEASDDEAAKFEALFDEDGTDCVDGYTRVGYHEYWEFVTACFTEQGCKDYLARNGHNLNETRIYAYGTYRNAEWKAIRDFLMSDRFRVAPAASNGEQEVQS